MNWVPVVAVLVLIIWLSWVLSLPVSSAGRDKLLGRAKRHPWRSTQPQASLLLCKDGRCTQTDRSFLWLPSLLPITTGSIFGLLHMSSTC